MKALILYVSMVVVGAVIASLIGVYVERSFGSAISLIVFLALFFANFVASWIVTIALMDGKVWQTA